MFFLFHSLSLTHVFPSAIQSLISFSDLMVDAVANSERLNLNVLKRLKAGEDQTEGRLKAGLGQCFGDSVMKFGRIMGDI